MTINHQCKRLISLILVLVMVLGFVPVHAHAVEQANPLDAAIIFSDLHTSKSNYKESTVREMFTGLKNTGLPFSSVTSAGDVFSVNEDSGKYTGDTSKITGYIRDSLGNSSIPMHYVWSDHDRYGTGISKESGFVYGAGSDGIYGTADDANYYIYSLSMADLSTNDRYGAGFSSNSQVTATIAAFETNAAKLDQSKPLLIASHQPLVDIRNDNGHALEWCNAINRVAKTIDVAFFFGHNHKYDTAASYYYAKGSTMPVADSNLNTQNVTINFSHICAGYMEPSSTGSTSNTTRSGTVMVVAIYEDTVRYTTYNKSGIYNGSYALDVYVPRDHAVSEPELVVSGTSAYFVGEKLNLSVVSKTGSKTEDVTSKASIAGYNMNATGDYTVQIAYGDLSAEFAIMVREKTFRDAATGVSVEVSVPGATSMTVTPVTADAGPLLTGSVGYNITLNDYTKGDGALVTLPVPTGVTKPTVVNVADNGSKVKVAVTESADGKTVSFSTDLFGTFLVGQENISEDLDNSVVGGGTAYEEKTVYVRVDSFENGGKYLIIGENKASGGDKIAYLNNNGSEGWEVVSVNSGSITDGSTTYSNGYIELDNDNAVWTATSASSGVTLSNNNRYIGGTDANTLKSSSSDAAKMTYDASAARLKTASGDTRYLYYSTYESENWKWATSSSSSSSSRNMWIYKEVTVREQVSAPVTYTLQATDLNHELTDYTAQLQFNLLADGAVADLPADGRYNFQIVGDTNGIIDYISGTGLITFNKAEGSCYVKISFTWSEGTVYTYVKVTAEADPNACEHTYTTTIVAPTCTQEGYTVYTCECGDSYTADYVAAVGHTAVTAVVIEPTCETEGYTTYTCFCGHSWVADQVAAAGHVAVTSEVIEPTCETEGYTIYTCSCGHSWIADQVAASHNYSVYSVTVNCTEDGFTRYTCSACGYSYTANFVEAYGHNYIVTEMSGYNVYTCEHCNHSYSDQIVTHYSRVNVLTKGSNYVVTMYDGGKYYALTHKGTTLSAVEVEHKNGEIVSEVTDEMLWKFANNKLSYEYNGKTYYLYATGSNKNLTVNTYYYSEVALSGTKLKLGSYYLRYNNGRVTSNKTAGTSYMFVEN